MKTEKVTLRKAKLAASEKPLRLEWVAAGELADKKNPANWRRHPARQLDALKDLISDPDIGWAGVILYNEATGNMIDGHARVESVDARTPVPVLIGSWSPEAEKKILLTLDPLAGMAEIDTTSLQELLGQVDFDSDALKQIQLDLKDLLNLQETLGETDPDAIPEVPKKAKTKPGDLWQLGEHRLLCGDCTKAEDVARLMKGEKAACGFFDPPYGIGYQSNVRTATPAFEVLKGDSQVDARWVPLAVESLCDGAAAYICTRWDVYPQWHQAIMPTIPVKNVIVWDKVDWSSGDLRGNYSPRHEFILFCTKGRHLLRGHRDSNVWSFGALNKQAYVHPTQKKVELPACAIAHSSDAGNVVTDSFVGSGTTIIAAEQLGRRCYAMEIEPRYVDVAVARWENFTGKKAERQEA